MAPARNNAVMRCSERGSPRWIRSPATRRFGAQPTIPAGGLPSGVQNPSRYSLPNGAWRSLVARVLWEH